jgi:hypothetical protein
MLILASGGVSPLITPKDQGAYAPRSPCEDAIIESRAPASIPTYRESACRRLFPTLGDSPRYGA